LPGIKLLFCPELHLNHTGMVRKKSLARLHVWLGHEVEIWCEIVPVVKQIGAKVPSRSATLGFGQLAFGKEFMLTLPVHLMGEWAGSFPFFLSLISAVFLFKNGVLQLCLL